MTDSCWGCKHMKYEIGGGSVVFRCRYDLSDVKYIGRLSSDVNIETAKHMLLIDYKNDWCPIDGVKSSKYRLEDKLKEEYWKIDK